MRGGMRCVISSPYGHETKARSTKGCKASINVQNTTFVSLHISLSFTFITNQGGDSQNILRKFVRFFETLDLKILRLFRLGVLFEADIIKG